MLQDMVSEKFEVSNSNLQFFSERSVDLCLFALLLYVPVNNFSVMLGCVFPG